MVHIFDVDHTLYNGSTVIQFLFLGLKRRQLPLSLILSLPFLTIFFLVNRRNGSVEEKLYSALKNIPKEKMENIAQTIFEGKIKKNLNYEINRIIRAAQERKEVIILATSSFKVIIEPIADFYKADYLVATELEYNQGKTTGKLIGEPPFGHGKRDKITQLLKNNGISPDECSFYTDSHRDLPLMEAVELPVAVNPTRKLKRTAIKRGWEIISSKKNLQGV